MSTVFNEGNTVEQMFLETAEKSAGRMSNMKTFREILMMCWLQNGL